jgi:predicted solute-binding protein
VIAVRNDVLATNKHVIDQILEIINTTTREFKEIPSIDRTLASRFNQKTEDIQEWLQLTRWSQKKPDKKTFEKIQNQLFDLKIIETKAAYESVIK